MGDIYEEAGKRSICKIYSRNRFYLTAVDFYAISCGALTHFFSFFSFSFCYIEGAYRVRGGRRNERKSFWFSTLVFLVFGILFLLCGFGNWVLWFGGFGYFWGFLLAAVVG